MSDTHRHSEKESIRIGKATNSSFVAIRTPPPLLRIIWPRKKKLISDQQAKIVLSDTVSFNDVSVTTVDAELESTRDERAMDSGRTLLILAYKNGAANITQPLSGLRGGVEAVHKTKEAKGQFH